MANWGFVYCLGHDLMPDVYKIGMTERSPSMRCEEISSSTGVPGPFEILFFIEVTDPARVERSIHSLLSASRVCTDREFFQCDVRHIHKKFKVYEEDGWSYAETMKGKEALYWADRRGDLADLVAPAIPELDSDSVDF